MQITGRIDFKNGDYYFGGMKYGLPEGQGVYFNKDGTSHTGIYKGGQLQNYSLSR